MTVLLTGGAGYIGSHTAVELMSAGYEAIIADNFSNSSPIVIDRLEQITGKRPKLYNVDVSDKSAFEKVFTDIVVIPLGKIIDIFAVACVPVDCRIMSCVGKGFIESPEAASETLCVLSDRLGKV